MKKALIFLLAFASLLGTLAGCGASAPDGKPEEAAAAPSGTQALAFAAANEILTYDRVDPARTQLTVSRTGNIEVRELCEAFEAQNPDVQIQYLDITGGVDGYKPLVEWVARGYAPDVVISSAEFFGAEDTAAYFENLSADPVLQNYEAAALQRTATAANIYWLPGPSDISAIAYNKTLFERYGWAVPKSFDEFVALCAQIREDTNGEVEPWNPNAKYTNEIDTALQAMAYGEVFAGVENREWLSDFASGATSDFSGHMKPYYDMIQTLIDNGILRTEHFSYSATTRGKEFAARKIAMINTYISRIDSQDFEFGYMPFPATDGGVGYICDAYSCFLGLPVKERGAAEEDAVRRFVEYFSSVEGQQVFIGDSLRASNVKNVPLNRNANLSALQEAIDVGHLFARLEFRDTGGRANFSFSQHILDMLSGAHTAEECMAAVDALPAAESAAAPAAAESVAAVPADMTMLETSFYLADAYRETMDAQIGLIAHGAAYRGNLMRLFAGDVTAPMLTVLKPRSFENGSKLQKVTMTGAQLLAALNDPPNYDGKPADCLYAFSGLRCELAPWAPRGEKYLSVALADGTAIDPAALYTVALWQGSVGEEYITETVAAYEGSFEELLGAKMRADGTVKAANDGRYLLRWEE